MKKMGFMKVNGLEPIKMDVEYINGQMDQDTTDSGKTTKTMDMVVLSVLMETYMKEIGTMICNMAMVS